MRERLSKARALLDELAAQDHADPRVHPDHGTRWWVRDEVAPAAVVLLHGLTNSPPQYERLGAQLHEHGHAVIVPRLPYHGFRDRMTDAIAALRASELEAAALRAVIVAALCGRRVVVAGISIGATLAGWLAARTRIDLAIAVAPFCGIKELYAGTNDGFGALLRAAPNAFGWWDPRSKEAQPPPHGYPRFATRTLGESLRISTEMAVAASEYHARRVDLVLNANDPVVNNAHAARRFDALRALGVDVRTRTLHGLPEIHDIIEPAIPQARTELVYPTLIELVGAR